MISIYLHISKWEMDSDKYFEFLKQQVKELHMERGQGFITSMFRALTSSRCKTRRKQVTGIPPTPVTIGSHTPAALSNVLTSKTLVDDVTQEEIEAGQPSTLEEETMADLRSNNDLGESYVAEVQQSGKHISVICTDMEETQAPKKPF